MDAVKYLAEEFNNRKAKNSRYSLRAFSKMLDMPAGRVSEIFSRKRAITYPMALKMANSLNLTPDKKTEFLSLIDDELKYKDNVRKLSNLMRTPPCRDYQKLSEDTFKVLADCHYYVILNLIRNKDFQSDPTWIADRLGLSEEYVIDALERLKKLEMIDIDQEGNIIRTAKKLTTAHDVPSKVIRQAHKQELQLAAKAMDEVNVNDRDIQSLTMPINKEKLKVAKEMISIFIRQLGELLNDGNTDEVYNLNIQLFPMTQIKDGEVINIQKGE